MSTTSNWNDNTLDVEVSLFGSDYACATALSRPITWTGLTADYRAENGFIVEPITDQEALRKLGADFRSDMAALHQLVAERCRAGHLQVLRIKDKNEQSASWAEVAVRQARVIVRHHHSHIDAEAPAAAKDALKEWCVAVNDRRLLLNVAIQDNYFEQPWPEQVPLSWPALTDRFVADTGLIVEPVSDQEALRRMGFHFRNSLSLHSDEWAKRCQAGEIQIVRVCDDGGQLWSNAGIAVSGGELAISFHLCMNNSPAPQLAEAALAQWISAVNEQRIPLRGQMSDGRFAFDSPTWTPDEPTTFSERRFS